MPILHQSVIFLLVGTLVIPSSLVLSVRADDADAVTPRELPQYRITRAISSIRVDARLDEEAWREALTIDLPFEIHPGENVPAPVHTECRITYDDQNLYLAFRADDPEPSRIRARLADRDTPWQDDFVGIMFDPFNDERRGFEFFVNPLGVQMDLSRNDVGTGDPEDPTWDAIWESAGRITKDGYVVEAAIPFTSIRFPRTEGEQTWGLFTFRAYPRSVRHQITSVPFDRNLNCFFCQSAKVIGFERITPGRNLELDPTLTTLRTDTLGTAPEESILSGDPDTDIGLSVRWGITPNLSFNTTINPDFSQVEADAAQLDVNNRFTLFFPEKRPFFLEGADFFQTPLQAVHTRSVVDPRWGIKLTGKEGNHAVGLYATQDDVNTLIFPSNQESDDTELEQKVASGIFRYRRDVGRNSTLGAFLTAREGEGYHNRVYGLDGLMRISTRDVLRFQALGSSTAYPADVIEEFDQPQGGFDGYGITAEYVHETRNWNWWAEYEELDPLLRVDSGFLPRVDTRNWEIGGEHIVWGGADRWFSSWSLGSAVERITDLDGTLTDQDIVIFANYSGPMQSFLSLDVVRRKEFFEDVTYDQTNGGFHFNFQPSGQINFWFTGRFGDAIDFDNSRAAKRIWGGPGFRYYFGRHLQLFYDNTYEVLHVNDERLFRALLNQFRLIYQFNVRTFVRAIVQHTDVSRNLDLYDPEDEFASRSREVFTQFLFSYKINPQTVLFLGYSDNHDDEDRSSIVQQDRTFCCKLGYAWLL
jgi:hypothetical protein